MALAQKLQKLLPRSLLVLGRTVGANYVKCKANQLSLARTVFITQQQQQQQEQQLSEKKEVTITFLKANGEKIKATGKVGDSILDIVVNNDIDLDGYGACEGTLTCSTCHLIFSKDIYDQLPSKPSDEEMDMLDLAYELTDTSRLGCQIIMSKELDGIEVRVPSTINDARSS